METDRQEPRWVATGPFLPFGMFVATLIAALRDPGSILLWVTVVACAVGTLVLTGRAFYYWRSEAGNRREGRGSVRSRD